MSSPLAVAGDAAVYDYWDVDDVPLTTYAYGIKSIGGSRIAPPPMRGENLKIPFSPGQRFMRKVPDSRIISLDMWVLGADPDGTIRDTAKFDYNWHQLVQLLYRPDVEFPLTKRFRAGTDDTLTTATALAQFQQGLNPSMTGRKRAEFSVDLFLADPFFYSAAQTIDFGPLPGTNLSRTFTVAGDYSTRAIDFHVEGPVTSPMWTNSTSSPSTWCRYNTVVNDGDSLDIDVTQFKATATVAGVQKKSAGYMQHSGSHFWMELEPGTATVAFSAASGTGISSMTYQPVWL